MVTSLAMALIGAMWKVTTTGPPTLEELCWVKLYRLYSWKSGSAGIGVAGGRGRVCLPSFNALSFSPSG